MIPPPDDGILTGALVNPAYPIFRATLACRDDQGVRGVMRAMCAMLLCVVRMGFAPLTLICAF
jgi:hypothetical protein